MDRRYTSLRRKLRENRNPKASVNSKKIHELIKEIDRGEIQKPDFQRDYEWKVENIIPLVNSILKGDEYGIISIFTSSDLSYSDDYLFPKFEDGTKNVKYIADGLQRVTTIYSLYKGLSIGKINFKNFKIDFENGECIYSEDCGVGISIYDALSFDGDVDLDETGESDLLFRVKEMFDETDVHYINSGDMSYYDAISYFITKNTSSKLLKVEAMLKAEYKKNGIDIQSIFEENDDIREYMNDNLYRYLKLYTPMFGLGSSESDHREAASKNTEENIKKFNSHLSNYIKFLKSIGFDSIDKLPYYSQFESLVVESFLNNRKTDNEKYKKMMIKFLISTTIAERYTNATSSKIREDIANNLSSGKFIPYTIEKVQDFRFGSAGSHQRFIKWFMSYNGVSFATGTPINSLIQSKVSLDKHHVFPKNANYEKEFKFNLDNIFNMTMIEHSRNRGDISNKLPSEYIKTLNKSNIETNFIDISSLENDDYDLFIKTRIEKLNDELQSYF